MSKKHWLAKNTKVLWFWSKDCSSRKNSARAIRRF